MWYLRDGRGWEIFLAWNLEFACFGWDNLVSSVLEVVLGELGWGGGTCLGVFCLVG